MPALMQRCRSRISGSLRVEDGQVIVMTAMAMVVLLGMVAMVVDLGAWMRQQRASQATVDAAALAGAQSLPSDPANATALATSFANKNGGISGATITIGNQFTTNDKITVTQQRSAGGFFAGVLGVSFVQIHAKASAIAEMPSEASNVA